jgi:N-acetylmuramoyl-L-alanine amidase
VFFSNIGKSKQTRLIIKKVSGVETLIDSIYNVNKPQDHDLAQVVQDNLLAALNEIDPTNKNLLKYNRKVKEQKLSVLRNLAFGNTGSSHPCPACLVEIEFMDVLGGRAIVPPLTTLKEAD